MKVTDTKTLRKISNEKSFVSLELYKSEPDGHKYKIGDKLILKGLVDFPEFNGQTVEVTGIREDGFHGKAYYIKGEINKFLNWVYEYRLNQKEG